MKISLAAFGSALIFGIGLGLSGMTLPSKIIGFLDVFGNWDPSMAFVMLGAISTYAIGYRIIIRRQRPVLSAEFRIPRQGAIDSKLVLGSFIFGIGWGWGGFCPGPAIMSAVTGQVPVLIFLGSMVAGTLVYRLVYQRTARFVRSRQRPSLKSLPVSALPSLM